MTRTVIATVTAAMVLATASGYLWKCLIDAEGEDALRALQRPLPHYGGQSYVLFENGRAQQRGLWPLGRGALYRDLGKL